MKHRNPKFGCVRIAQQSAYAFGIEINEDVVRRVLAIHSPRLERLERRCTVCNTVTDTTIHGQLRVVIEKIHHK
jgi:hypothetical protein